MRLSPSIVLLRTQTDERLTELAAEGSEPAFTALVERYRRLVLRACMRVLPEARAEDATQQVFVSAWKALKRGDEVRSVRPWLLKIARNTALNALRTPGYEYDELAESLGGGTAPQAELERRDVMRQTLQGLANLPENQREALLRTAVQGASHADIARDLGISEGATRQLVLRARSTLRSAVSAVTPLPLLHWAANASTSGVAEAAAAGGSTAGVALLAKAGAVLVIAGGAAATPAIVHEVRGDKPEAARAAERTARGERAERRAEPTPIVAKAAEDAAATPTREGRRRGHRSRRSAHAAPGGRRHHGRDRQGRRRHGRGHAGPGGAEHEDQPTVATTPGPAAEHGGKGHGGKGNRGRGHDDAVGFTPSRGPHGGSGHGHPEKDKPAKAKPVKDKPARDNSGHGKPEAAPIPTPTATITPTPTPTPTPGGHKGHGNGDEDDQSAG